MAGNVTVGVAEGEPAICPSCDLIHDRRADWRCPRCGTPVDLASPQAEAKLREQRGFPRGSYLGATVLAISAALYVLLDVRHGVHGKAGTTLLIVTVADGALAVLLFLGWHPARRIVLGRLVVGLFALHEYQVEQLPAVVVLFNYVLQLGLVLLIAGRPGPVLRALGVLLSLPLLLFLCSAVLLW